MINNLKDVGELIGATAGLYYDYQGGYCMANDAQLAKLRAKLQNMDLEQVKDKLRIGVHRDVQVTS